MPPLVEQEHIDRSASASSVATTACPFCGAGCGMLLDDSSSFPLVHHPVTQGALCLRGWSAGELLRSPLRITRARARNRGDPPAVVAPEEALQVAVERLVRIRGRYGGGSIGILGSARITCEESLLLRRLACALDTPNLDSCQRLGIVPLAPFRLAAIENAARILVVGANLAARHAQVARRVLRALERGAQVRLVDARRTQLASLGIEHVRCLPGREVDAAAGAANGDLILVGSEVVLWGEGAQAVRTLGPRGAVFLPDYANQRGLQEAGAVPPVGGLAAYEMLQRAAAGDLKALLVFADDPFEFFPTLAAAAFAGTELTVVTDAVRTHTTDHADVLLPGGLLAEKVGTVLGCEDPAAQLEPVQPPIAGWTEGRVVEELLRSLGADAAPPPPPTVPAPGADGPGADAPSGDYPFLLALGTRTFWSTHALVRATVTAWREARSVFADFPPGFVSVNPDDARSLRVPYGGTLRLESPTGAVTLPARPNRQVCEGTVWVPMHCWEQVGTALGALAFDDGMRIPVFRPRAVRISRVEAQ